MKRLILLATIGLFISSCQEESFNHLVLDASKGDLIETPKERIVTSPYSLKELENMLNYESKATWPKVTVTFTFGGFGPNSPCVGCDNCGCCLGICIQIEDKSKLVTQPLTQIEIDKNERLLNRYIDIPGAKKFVMVPSHNIDNGDGYLHVLGDCTFSEEVNDFIGRDIILKDGSYEILYNPAFPNGVVVVNTY